MNSSGLITESEYKYRWKTWKPPKVSPGIYMDETAVCLKDKVLKIGDRGRERQRHFSSASVGNEAAEHTH